MRLLEPLDQLEQNEELLRQRVNALPDEQRKEFYKTQSKKLKDPDTYATLNWFFLGGAHHFYLGRYVHFAVELTLLIISIVALVAGYSSAIYIIMLLVLVELPYLFFSQKIARQYNYDLSCEIYNELLRR